jgi:CheY-like chemotaxis protein
MGAVTSSGSARPRILVVEDEADVRRLLGHMLNGVGEVTLAADGLDALEQLHGGLRPDVIVTDLMMPRVDGLELAAALKGDPVLARIPLVMLTAKTGARDVIAGIKAGARHYVTKPFTSEEIVGKVRKALEGRPAR